MGYGPGRPPEGGGTLSAWKRRARSAQPATDRAEEHADVTKADTLELTEDVAEVEAPDVMPEDARFVADEAGAREGF